MAFTKQILLYFGLILLFIDIINADVTLSPELIKKFNIRQIRKGINNETVPHDGHAAFKMKIYEKTEKGKGKIVYDDVANSIIGVEALPECLEFAILHLNIQERIILDCPSIYAFTDSHLNHYEGVMKNKDYIIDIQLWNIGDIYHDVD